MTMKGAWILMKQILKIFGIILMIWGAYQLGSGILTDIKRSHSQWEILIYFWKRDGMTGLIGAGYILIGAVFALIGREKKKETDQETTPQKNDEAKRGTE